MEHWGIELSFKQDTQLLGQSQRTPLEKQPHEPIMKKVV